MWLAPGRGGESGVFPLSTHSSGRYLVTANGAPRPSLGRTSWNVVSLSVAARTAFLEDTLARGFNAIELAIPHRDPRSTASPFCGNGSAPFLKLLNGSDWTGSFSYGGSAPDFTTPNETYWLFADVLIDYCASRGIALHLFPAYVGFDATDQGWMTEMVANGTTKMQTYGAFIANRYRNRGNIVWMMGGDKGTGARPFNGSESAVESSFLTGLRSITGRSTQYSAEWDGPSIATDQVDFGGFTTFNGSYSWQGETATYSRQAWSHSPTLPAFLDEEPYDEEGPDGDSTNPNATQPVRRFNWWGWLNAIGGYCAGNGYIWKVNSGYASHFASQGQVDCMWMNRFIQSCNWWLLVPSGLSGIGTLITANAGNINNVNNTSDYIASAASPDGSLLVAYLAPGAGNPTVDMTKMRGTTTARWYNPTTGAYSAIGSFSNSGTQSFTKPGDNGTGFNDWVLRLDA
jgi:hypothetical protein